MDCDCRNRHDLLMQISEVQFVCVELNLYTDTHPDDTEALADLRAYSEKLKMLMSKYEEKFGPLMGFGHCAFDDDKSWALSKWPWE